MPTLPAPLRAWIAPGILCGTTLFAALAAHSNTGALHANAVAGHDGDRWQHGRCPVQL
jgi:hypothetical protein